MNKTNIFIVTLFTAGPFLIQVSFGELLFAGGLHRRDHFYARLVLGVAAELLLGTMAYSLCSLSSLWLINITLCYLLLFSISLLLPALCFDCGWVDATLDAVSAYMVQHIPAQFTLVFFNTQTLSVNTAMPELLVMQLVNWAIFGLTMFITWLLFIRKRTMVTLPLSEQHSLSILSLTTLLIVLVLSSARDAYADQSFALMFISRLFSVFCCIFLFYLRFFLLERGRLEQEREELLRLHALEREQYEQSRENIELINIKCHDLKRRIESWESKPVDPSEVREMHRLIGIYDASVSTGCDTLDTLLTERSLYCEGHGIRLNCIVDGSKLSFMTVGDICSLFGNAIENAIEAVSRLNMPDERCVSFQVRASRGMLTVTIENNYAGPLRFDNGLPITTKTQDAGYHGYGLKSIRMVAEKYGGQLTVTADELFHLNVLIPMPGSSLQ